MKAQVLQENLKAGLAIVARAVAAKSALPVLKNILIAAEDGRIRLASTNLGTSIVVWVGGKTKEVGALTVPARTLLDTVDAITKGSEINLSATEQTLQIRAEGGRSTINGIDAAEFPLVPTEFDDGWEKVLVDGKKLRWAISKVIMAAATDDSRPILNSGYLKIGGDKLILAAADGFRMAECVISISPGQTGNIEAVIPLIAMRELFHMLGMVKDSIEIAMSNERVAFRSESALLVSQRVEGVFPDYQQIIPRSSTTRAVTNAHELVRALRVVEIFARESANTAYLKFEEEKVKLSGRSVETGNSEAVVETTLDGSPLEIALNVDWLIDSVGSVETEKVSIGMTTDASPVLIRPVDQDGLTYVMMPMHIGK